MDLYNFQRKIEVLIKKIENSNKISDNNKKTLDEFYSYCVAEGLSNSRVRFYLDKFYRITLWLKKDFGDSTKEDIIKLLAKINKLNIEDNSKKGYKVSLKKFYRWLRINKGYPKKYPIKELKGKKLEDEGKLYPKEVRWFSTNLKNNNHRLPEEFLTKDEVLKLVDVASHPRNKAFIFTLYESSCRIGEILTLKRKHVRFDNYGAILIVSGKTGMRRVRVIGAAPYLFTWINHHPDSGDPNAYLWPSLKSENNKCLSYGAVLFLLQVLKKKAKIKKRINPHSFRHAHLTELARCGLNEAQLKAHAGWVQGSGMAGIYIHLSGKDTDDAILAANGIKKDVKTIRKEEEERKKLIPKTCPRCKKQNGSTLKICEFCGAPLDLKTAIELDQKESMMTNLIVKIARTLEKTSKEKIHFEELDFIIQPNNKELKIINRVK